MSAARHDIIASIRKRWTSIAVARIGIYALCISLAVSGPGYYFIGAGWWTVPVLFCGSFALMLLLTTNWRVSEREVIRFMDATFPQFEESCSLLLRKEEEMNTLERLQATRLKTSIEGFEVRAAGFTQKLKNPLLLLCAAAAFFMMMLLLPKFIYTGKRETGAITEVVRLPAGLSKIYIHTTPPAYTRLPGRSERTPNLRIEEGARVSWTIRTTKAADSLIAIFNDSLRIPFARRGSDGEKWYLSLTPGHPGFYQLKVDTSVSEIYRLELVPDRAPIITVTSPAPNTTIDFGQPATVAVKAAVTDDYGVKTAFIIATVAKGKGEGVSFKQHMLPFPVSFAGAERKYPLDKLISLTGLAMGSGDELYFYISATDTRGQEQRSDIYIVSMPDTASLMSMDGLLNGVNLKPEYFRSQRQIIIETEQLLREKDTISQLRFNDRSNNLGIDQKLLRLRYGKFLGEEASSNESEPGDKGLDANEFGDANAIIDAFTDKHDNSEDAGYFDAATKQQLKATLTEMWNAELRLRTFKPREALPYEYKALRLLKDLQQKSRAYVAKTSFTMPPLKPEKRLTGKLDKVAATVTTRNEALPVSPEEAVRRSLSVLAALPAGAVPSPKDQESLRALLNTLGAAAIRDPAQYVEAYQALKNLCSGKPAVKKQQMAAVRAMQKLLSLPHQSPGKSASPPEALKTRYFENLQKQPHP